MNYIVIGCGRVGSELAYRLFQRGHKVTVIDHQERSFINLPPEFLGRTIQGEALNREILHRAGIEQADGIALVTSSDTVNAVIAHVARTVYHVPNIIVRNYDVRWRPVYESFNLQIISSASWGAQRIEELLYHQEMRSVFSAGNGEVEVYEFMIPEIWNGRPLGSLVSDCQCTPVALTRAGRAMLPDADTNLSFGDILVVSATFEGITELHRKLQIQQEV